MFSLQSFVRAASGINITQWIVALVLLSCVSLVPTSASAAEMVREQQWYLEAMHVVEAQKTSRGSGVVVGLMDSGVDAGHPDLTGQILSGGRLSGTAIIDGRSDPIGHGTNMAGLIVAKPSRPSALLGVAPEAKVLPVAVGITRDDWSAGIRWLVDHGAGVINISAATGNTASPNIDAIKYALANDVVVIVAAGNKSDTSNENAFGYVPGVIVVSATTKKGAVASGSITGASVGLAAPGEDIVTTASAQATGGSGYQDGSGTSQAAALVSGVAALVRSHYPNLDAANVVNRLTSSAIDKGASGRDTKFGYGIVDAERALTMNIATVAQNPLTVNPPAMPSMSAEKLPSEPAPSIMSRVTFYAVVALFLTIPAMIFLVIFWRIRLMLRRSVLRSGRRWSPQQTTTSNFAPQTGAYQPQQQNQPMLVRVVSDRFAVQSVWPGTYGHIVEFYPDGTCRLDAFNPSSGHPITVYGVTQYDVVPATYSEAQADQTVPKP